MSQEPVIDDINCVAFRPGFNDSLSYGYVPSLVAGIVFCVLFGLTAVLHTFTAVRHRLWWQLVFATGAITEVIGWAGRTWSHDCPYQNDPFLMQITTLIIAPSFFTAGIYVILGRLIKMFGPHVSPITPKTYLYTFVTLDVVSLVIQAVGGALASIAFSDIPKGDTETGTNIMVGGIVFQLVAIIVFSVLFTWVMVKAFKTNVPALREMKIRLIVAATIFAVIVIVIRSIYRTIELLQGWQGYLITTEWFFLVFDGATMVMAVSVFNLAQPRWVEEDGGRPKASMASSVMDDFEMQNRGDENEVVEG